MALPQPGVPFVPTSQEQIRDALLADYRYEALKTADVDPAVQPGTDNWWWASAHAATAMLQFSNIGLSVDAITPLNATGDDLDDWRISQGLHEVQPSPSTGKVVLTVTGSSTVNANEPMILPSGLRARVVGTWVGVITGDEIDVVSVDTGSATNLDAGAIVQFVVAPTNVNEKTFVSKSSPLRGGSDKETDARKRVRVLNAVANKPGGGNWAQMRELTLESLASVQDAFVYPALGGPASVKIVPVRDIDPDNAEFTRALNGAALNIVKNSIYANLPDGVEIVVEAAVDTPVDVALAVTLPLSSLSGGTGQGWVDQSPWPPLTPGETRVTVASLTDSQHITLFAATATAPIPGQTHVAWWSPQDRKFRQFLVTAKSGIAGAWVLTLDRPLVSDDGTIVAIGDFISPAAINSDAYGTSWLTATRNLGPAENTGDSNRTPRALRHPYTSDESPAGLSFRTLRTFQEGHPEISDIGWSYKSITTPTPPASVADAVPILVPQHFGLYLQT